MDYNKLFLKLFFLIIFINIVFGANQALAETRVNQKNLSEVVFYGRLWAQYDVSDNSTSNNNKISSIRDDEGMGRIGIKGKSFISNGYVVNYKVEYAIDLGDGDATGGVVGDGNVNDETVAMGAGKGYATVGQATVDIATNMQSYTDALESTGSFQNWVSVFGKAEPGYAINYTHTNKIGADDTNAHGVTDPNNADRHIGHKEFGAYVDPVKSPFLDGHFIYTVIGGTVKREPALIVTDFYAPADEFLVVQP